MKPKEKAYKLVDQYYSVFAKRLQLSESFTSSHRYKFCKPLAKECAFVAVDDIFEFMKMDDEYTETVSNANSKWVDYWLEVKQEIEKL